jgi:hypothetical protein
MARALLIKAVFIIKMNKKKGILFPLSRGFQHTKICII